MNFSYKNKSNYQNKREQVHLSEQWIKKVFFIAFSFSFSFLLLGKVVWIFNNKAKTTQVRSLASTKQIKTISLSPIVVNLKSDKGPQLTRVQVNISTYEESVKKELLSKNKSLEKHLLFVLSGQDSKKINKNKSIFEKKLISQINAFLSSGNINEVKIKFIN